MSTHIMAHRFWHVALAAWILSTPLFAQTYRVGPGQAYTRVSDVAPGLQPGDVVEVTGDIEDSFILARSGAEDEPITIRGITRVENGRIVRPKVNLAERASNGIIVRGDWCVIEGLDISGAFSPRGFRAATAVYVEGDSFVLRNCHVHRCLQGLYTYYQFAGDVTVSFCEFDSIGGVSTIGSNLHSLYLCSTKPGALVTVEHCWFHDAIGGAAFIKSRCSRNAIRYNWFESPYSTALTLVDVSERPDLPEGLYPMHSDIVGNVFFGGWSAGPQNTLVSLGGEHETISGTQGDFNLSHNLFVATKRLAAAVITVHGCVDNVRLFNNAFLEYGINDWLVYERGLVWDTPRAKAFAERRGSSEPVVSGAGNWISEKAGGIPDGLTGTIVGLDPGVENLLERQWRPLPGSPLAGAGVSDLPEGACGSLGPAYEPVRGVPPDLKAPLRRAAVHPSIGPFEPAAAPPAAE